MNKYKIVRKGDRYVWRLKKGVEEQIKKEQKLKEEKDESSS